MDVLTPEQRQRNMSHIRGANTKPELLIRKALHARGLRFRLHQRDLPGKPDLVFARYSTVIFVHGCFWHAHDCHLATMPATRAEFWQEKIIGNAARDQRALTQLRADGWKVGVVWECALRGMSREPLEHLIENIVHFIQREQVEARNFIGKRR